MMTFAFSSLQPLQTRIARQKWPHITPLLAALAATAQTRENTTALSSLFATLTRRVKHKSCVCPSYKGNNILDSVK